MGYLVIQVSIQIDVGVAHVSGHLVSCCPPRRTAFCTPIEGVVIMGFVCSHQWEPQASMLEFPIYSGCHDYEDGKSCNVLVLVNSHSHLFLHKCYCCDHIGFHYGCCDICYFYLDTHWTNAPSFPTNDRYHYSCCSCCCLSWHHWRQTCRTVGSKIDLGLCVESAGWFLSLWD